MKLVIRRIHLGDRLCFPDIDDGRPVDLQATYARQLEAGGNRREDAIPRSRREIAETLPALLQTDPTLSVVRALHEWATAVAETGDLTDVVSTGTPPGVRRVQAGDELRGEIGRLGGIENLVVADSIASRAAMIGAAG